MKEGTTLPDQHAPTVLEATLRAFDDIDLLRRLAVRRTIDIFHPNSSTMARPHTIFHDKIEYLGQSTLLIVFRPKGAKNDERAKTEYAFFNDTTSIYQPISVTQIIRFLKHPPEELALQTDLERVVARADEARERIKFQFEGRS